MVSTPKPEISFIGLGAMGFGMATNLLSHGYKVRGFDAYTPTLERFRTAGGTTSTSPAACVSGRPFCVVMVATAVQAQAALFEGDKSAVAAFSRGVALLLCSTVSCANVQSLEAQLKAAGREDIYLIDCPVSGGAYRAAHGTLTIMAGGSDDALQHGNSLLQAMSDPAKLYLVHGGIGAGSNMKMCHQVLAAVQILGASEAMGFASRLGLDLEAVREAVIGGDAWSWMFENRIERMMNVFQPVASALTIILKDTGIITAEGRREQFATPMASTAEQVYLSGLARGWGADDDSGIVRAYLEDGKDLIGDSGREKLNLVRKLLVGIHTCAAAEALGFAKHVGLDLDQFFELASTAAGGSAVFSKGAGVSMLGRLKDGGSLFAEPSLDRLVSGLQEVMDEAYAIKCPLYLTGMALSLATAAKQRIKLL